MNTNEILAALYLPKNKYTQTHCSRLSEVYKFLKGIKADIISSEVSGVEKFLFAHVTKKKYSNVTRQMENNIIHEGSEMKANKITVKTSYGCYSFAVPVGNAFYFAVCELLGIEYQKAASEEKQAIKVIEIESSEIFSTIKKAAKFVSKDKLRPAMQCVLLNFENSALEVAAKNAHYLYMSKLYKANTGNENVKLLLSIESVKKLSGLKDNNQITTIKVYSDSEGSVNGVPVTFETLRYPDYKCVIPEYSESMTFDRVKLIATVKQVQTMANKSCKQVKFHLNGNIALSSQDVCFSFGSDATIPYISKTFPDMDTAFNAKFLNDVLGIFKSKELKMYSNGIGSKCSIFSDGNEKILLMPLSLDND